MSDTNVHWNSYLPKLNRLPKPLEDLTDRELAVGITILGTLLQRETRDWTVRTLFACTTIPGLAATLSAINSQSKFGKELMAISRSLSALTHTDRDSAIVAARLHSIRYRTWAPLPMMTRAIDKSPLDGLWMLAGVETASNGLAQEARLRLRSVSTDRHRSILNSPQPGIAVADALIHAVRKEICANRRQPEYEGRRDELVLLCLGNLLAEAFAPVGR